MSRITITRRREWNNRFRKVGIYLDGEKIGEIANGETRSFDIHPGLHQLRARIDWCGSRQVEFGITQGERRYFSIESFRFGRMIAPIVVGIVLLNIFYKYAVWLMLPVFLFLLYFLTLGRNDYLRLKEEDSWKTG